MKILAISKKVFLELLRDKRTLILLFIAPVFIMWLMNAAFSANTETNVSIAAVDVSDSIVKLNLSVIAFKREFPNGA